MLASFTLYEAQWYNGRTAIIAWTPTNSLPLWEQVSFRNWNIVTYRFGAQSYPHWALPFTLAWRQNWVHGQLLLDTYVYCILFIAIAGMIREFTNWTCRAATGYINPLCTQATALNPMSKSTLWYRAGKQPTTLYSKRKAQHPRKPVDCHAEDDRSNVICLHVYSLPHLAPYKDNQNLSTIQG